MQTALILAQLIQEQEQREERLKGMIVSISVLQFYQNQNQMNVRNFFQASMSGIGFFACSHTPYHNFPKEIGLLFKMSRFPLHMT